MPKYRVTVVQLVPDEELDHDDTITNPTGEYMFDAVDLDDALDQFHNSIPIARVDDFDVTAEKE